MFHLLGLQSVMTDLYILIASDMLGGSGTLMLKLILLLWYLINKDCFIIQDAFICPHV